MYPGSTKKDKYIDKTKKEEKDSENKEKKLQIKYSLDLDKIILLNQILMKRELSKP